MLQEDLIFVDAYLLDGSRYHEVLPAREKLPNNDEIRSNTYPLARVGEPTLKAHEGALITFTLIR